MIKKKIKPDEKETLVIDISKLKMKNKNPNFDTLIKLRKS